MSPFLLIITAAWIMIYAIALPPWSPFVGRLDVACIALHFVSSMFLVVGRNDLTNATLLMINASVDAWWLWTYQRRDRRPRPSRVLGRVRDLGHRLAVAHDA